MIRTRISTLSECREFCRLLWSNGVYECSPKDHLDSSKHPARHHYIDPSESVALAPNRALKPCVTCFPEVQKRASGRGEMRLRADSRSSFRHSQKSSSPTRHQNCPFLWHFEVSTTRKNKAGKGFTSVNNRIHTVEVRGSNPLAPTTSTRIRFIELPLSCRRRRPQTWEQEGAKLDAKRPRLCWRLAAEPQA